MTPIPGNPNLAPGTRRQDIEPQEQPRCDSCERLLTDDEQDDINWESIIWLCARCHKEREQEEQ